MMRSWFAFVVGSLGVLLAGPGARAQDLVFITPEEHSQQPPPPPDKPPYVKCTCDDLRKRLDEAERMRDAYARLYRGESIRFKSTLDERVGEEMGWIKGTVKPQAKPADETTTPEERSAARADCKWCDWICDVSMQKVHEGYHTWFRKYEGPFFTFIIVSELMQISQKTFVKFTELSEIGAHQAEATFLRDMIQLMEARGQCAGVTGTPSPWEMQRRWEEADKEVRFHMEIPQPEPPK